jgi:hypothetical protein
MALKRNLVPGSMGGATILWIAAILVLVVLKFAMVAQNEIVFLPSDNMTYVLYAQHQFWGTAYLPDRPVLTSLWMAFSELTGVRFRLLQEIIYVAASLLALLAVHRINSGRVFSLTFFVLVLFAPVVTYHLDFAMADGLYITQLLYLVSFLVLALSAGSKPAFFSYTCLAGAAAAAMIHTRMEMEFVGTIACAFGVLLWIKARSRATSPVGGVVLPIGLFCGPILLSIMLVLWLNASIFGYRGLTNSLSVNESKVMKQLMRIDGGHDGRYLPITARARELAYDASPTLKKWRTAIEDPWVIEMSKNYTGVPNSLDTQRYLYLLKRIERSSAHPGVSGIYDVPADVKASVTRRENELEKIASELQAAFDRGALPRRFAPSSLIDPVVASWLPYTPASLAKITGLLFVSPGPWMDLTGYGMLNSLSIQHSAVLNRDSRLTMKGPMQGLIVVDAGKDIVSMDLYVNPILFPMFGPYVEQPDQKLSSAVVKLHARSASSATYSFEFPPTVERWVPDTLALRIKSADDVWTNVTPLSVGAEVKLAASSNGVTSYQITKFDPIISSSQARSYRLQNMIAEYFPAILKSLCIVAIIILLFAHKKMFRAMVDRQDAALALSLCLVVLVSRIVLLVLVDVAAWHVDVRYVAPILPVLLMAICILLAMALPRKATPAGPIPPTMN